MTDRVVTFSIKPTDTDARTAVEKLKSHSDKTGISFSHLMIRAVNNLVREMQLDDNA